jgi:hypothetical protein
MSARVASGYFDDGDGFFLVSGVPAAEWARQLTVTCAGPVPPDSAIAAATQALCLAEGTGKTPRAGHGRPAVRFCRSSS